MSEAPTTEAVQDQSVLHGAVWAVVASDEDPGRLAVLAHARRIAEHMRCATVACVAPPATAGSRPPALTAKSEAAFAVAGASDTLVLEGVQHGPVALAHVLEKVVRQFQPRVLLLQASPEGRVTAPYLAARLGAGLTADCTAFVVKDYTVRSRGKRRVFENVLYQQRPALGGNIQATIVSPVNIDAGLPQMATVRPGPTVEGEILRPMRRHTFAVESTEADGGRHENAGPHETVGRDAGRGRPGPASSGTAVGPSRSDAADRRVRIERCKVLVSVGRGAGGGEGIRRFAFPLAAALRKRFDVDVEVSASRMVVDAGDLGRERQVGQTGKIVRPDIYIALGISGAAQHRAGMDNSLTIISVNADEDAPIRQISDVFVHGRVEDVVPALIETLSAAE